MRLRENLHKLPRGPLAHLIFEHRQENRDAWKNNENGNQQNNADERPNHKMVAAQIFKAGESRGHDSAKRNKQQDGGITQTLMRQPGADQYHQHAQRGITNIQGMADFVLTSCGLQWANNQKQRQAEPEPGNIDRAPAHRVVKLVCGRFKQTIVQSKGWQKDKAKHHHAKPVKNGIDAPWLAGREVQSLNSLVHVGTFF